MVVPNTDKVPQNCGETGDDSHCALCDERMGRIKMLTPMYTIKEWDEKFPDLEIKINTSPYRIGSRDDSQIREMKCSAPASPVKCSDGAIISRDQERIFDYVQFRNDETELKLHFFRKEEISDSEFSGPHSMVPGLLLVRNGAMLLNHSFPSFRCQLKKGRVVIGKTNQSAMFILYVPNTQNELYGATCQEVSEFLVATIGATDALLFDGGGSTKLSIRKEDQYLFLSENETDAPARPIPHFLGIDVPNWESAGIKIISNY